jgi:hypothetical protein
MGMADACNHGAACLRIDAGRHGQLKALSVGGSAKLSPTLRLSVIHRCLSLLSVIAACHCCLSGAADGQKGTVMGARPASATPAPRAKPQCALRGWRVHASFGRRECGPSQAARLTGKAGIRPRREVRI